MFLPRVRVGETYVSSLGFGNPLCNMDSVFLLLLFAHVNT